MHKYLFLLAFSLSLMACNNSTTTVNVNSQSDKNVALVNQYFEYFNAHEWDKMAEMYTETADFKDPSLGAGIVQQTRQQTKEKYAELQAIFPDLHDQIIQIYPSGEQHVVLEFVSSGTAANGYKFELPICTIFTFDNGKITQDFTYFDNSGGGEE